MASRPARGKRRRCRGLLPDKIVSGGLDDGTT
jgi:hypothetical protein